MKVLISGGSGFLGINLVRYLLSKGIQEIVVLDIADFDYPERSIITFVQGDIRDKSDTARAMEGCTHVVHAAAALPLYKPADIYSTDVKGTGILLKEAYNRQVERFIHISSTAVYGIPDHHPIMEDDPMDGVGPYGEAKILAEKSCLEYRKLGMCVPILRPKSFIGPERLGVFALFYDWAMDKRGFPMIGTGHNRYQLLDVDDLDEAIYITLTHPDRNQVNDTFNIGAKEFTTMKEDYQAVLDEAGFGKKIRTFPAWPMILTLRFLEMVNLSPLYKWVYETASKDSFVSIDKAEKILGFTPTYSNKDALIRNFCWYRENVSQFHDQNGISHRVPWNQGVLGYFKFFF